MQSLEKLRKEELALVSSYFLPDFSLLEIGGGSGYQASLLTKMGLNVKSIDVSDTTHPNKFYDVEIYNGTKIPYPDSSFDIVFSSNVLEHVKDINLMNSEILRVLKPSGIVIHILPTPIWRFWTSVSHYIYICIRILRINKSASSGNVPSIKVKFRQLGLLSIINKALLPGPHGEYSSALSELWYFSSGRWCKVFKNSGFNIQKVFSLGIFYTGYSIMPFLSIKNRKKIAKLLGSSTNVYIMKKA